MKHVKLSILVRIIARVKLYINFKNTSDLNGNWIPYEVLVLKMLFVTMKR